MGDSGERSSRGGSSEEEEAKRPTFTRGHWRPAEDEKLGRLIGQFGQHNWNAIAEHFQGRSGKSCRLRWFNQLNPRIIRRPFSEEEEERLLATHHVHWNKWAFIARLFPGRTDNSVTNHWPVIKARRKRNEFMSSTLSYNDPLKRRSSERLPNSGFAGHARGDFDCWREIYIFGKPHRIDHGFLRNFTSSTASVANPSAITDNGREYIISRGSLKSREHFYTSYRGITNFGGTFVYSKSEDADTGTSNTNRHQQRQEFRSIEQGGNLRPFIDFTGINKYSSPLTSFNVRDGILAENVVF